MSYSPKTSDSANRSNSALIGTTLDNAGGGSESNVWAASSEGGAGFAISGNAFVNAAGTAQSVYPGSTSAVDKQRASITVNGYDTCVCVRLNPSTGDCYSYGNQPFGSGGASQLSQHVGGVGTFAFQAGATIPNGTVITLQAEADVLTVYHDGVQVRTQSDSHYSTGVPGMLSQGSGAFSGDNFLYETYVAFGAASQLAVTTAPTQVITNRDIVVVVTVQDASGNTVTTDTSTVTLSPTMSAGTFVLTSGSLSAAAVAGVATITFQGHFAERVSGTQVTMTLAAADGALTGASTAAIPTLVRSNYTVITVS